ncbi:MAG: hypothetical protein ABH864_06285 [archaeon]
MGLSQATLFGGTYQSLLLNPNGGNVGIGTTAPGAKLEVNGNNFGGSILVTGGGGTDIAISDDQDHDWKYNTIYSKDDGSFVLQPDWDGTGTPENLLLIPDGSGKVGIGTTSPAEKLEVNGLIKIPTAGMIDNDSPGIVASSNDDFLYDGEYINNYGFGFHQYGSGTNAYISGYYGIDFFSGGAARMRINSDGNVDLYGKLRATNSLRTYAGRTTASYTRGGVGGYGGGNSKCNAQYSGSRMCIAADFINGVPTAGDYGWYSTFSNSDCEAWTNSLSGITGPFWTSAGTPGNHACSNSRQILCCK